MSTTGSDAFSFAQFRSGRNILAATLHRPHLQPAPWVIFSHGFTGNRLGPDYLYVKMSRDLASHGIASLRFDYGGAGESQGAFAEMSVSTMAADLISAVHYVRQNCQPTHCLLMGHSLGAAVAAMVAPDIQTRGLILLAPVATPLDHVQNYQAVLQNGPNERGLYELGPYEMALGFIEDLKSARPLEAIAQRYSGDLLIFHGDRDQRVSAAEAQAYADTARHKGLNVTYHQLTHADHRFSSVASRRLICEVMATWIKERFL